MRQMFTPASVYGCQARTFGQTNMKESTTSFKASDISIQKVDVRKIKPKSKKEYAFGKLFTDHMLSIDWTKADGW